MDRLRTLGIDLLGSRNAALRDLVRQVSAPIVAAQLGYSHQITQRHAALAAETHVLPNVDRLVLDTSEHASRAEQPTATRESMLAVLLPDATAWGRAADGRSDHS
jgi:antirestriction protein ArdC